MSAERSPTSCKESFTMWNFSKISGAFAHTTSSAGSSRRRGKTRLALEALEDRDLMSVVMPPVPAPPSPPTLPPIHINPATTPPTDVLFSPGVVGTSHQAAVVHWFHDPDM